MHGPHPRLVINSSVISFFITQTEIDIQGSDSSGFLLWKKVQFFKYLETWKIFPPSCLTVLLCYSWKLAEPRNIYTQTSPPPFFKQPFLSTVVSAGLIFEDALLDFYDVFVTMHVMFAKNFSWVHLCLSSLWMFHGRCWMVEVGEEKRQRDYKKHACKEWKSTNISSTL